MRQLVNIILTTVITLLVYRSSFAQFFSTSPDGIISINIKDNEEISREFFFANLTEASLLLGWEIIENTLPKEWGYSLCDNRICYNTVPNSAYMEPIIPNDFSFLRLALWNTSVGEGSLKIRIFDNNQSQHDTIEFRITHSSINSTLSNSKPVIYPNPVQSGAEVTVEFTSGKYSEIRILDFLGKEIQRLTVHISEKKKTLPVDGFVQGIYFVQFIDNKNSIALTKRMVIS